ncbi:MAG TPA: hypothetical protein VMV69_12725 [Pirellulales bacterium]|nr:hypothetical protein [Pirellulales bacterium]
MAGGTDLPLSISELEAALRAADPAALLAPPRILRRMIKHDREIGGIGLRVPHRKSYLIAAESLLKIVDRDELGLAADHQLPPRVIVLARPDTERLAAYTSGEALTKFWRLLFHVRVHAALDDQRAAGLLDDASVHRRIRRIGQSEFEEARLVLKQEDLLLPPPGDVSAYIEFAATYLELRYFADTLVPQYFPLLARSRHVDDVLAGDLDADALFASTRLPHAPLPRSPADDSDFEPADDLDDQDLALAPARASEGLYRRLNRRADRSAAIGNAVRAAILRSRAARHVRPSLASRARGLARDELKLLTDRLQAALDFGDRDRVRWSKSLTALLGRSAQGFWTRESRTLYDLQKVCIDCERDVYALDMIEWALSRGKLPIKRHLPGQRELLVLKHLRVASRRAVKARLGDDDRRRLVTLLESAVRRAEQKLRERFRPAVAAALEQLGLEPRNLPERVAHDKLIEELLDRVVDDGFLAMSDLRDAISRNNLKLPDLADGAEFVRGDQLLRADRRLATLMDGVYHRGEVYQRWPQRLSSLAFGTGPGRLLVRYLALPYGGAYVLLKFAEHLVELLLGRPAVADAGAAASLTDSGVATIETAHFAQMSSGEVLLAVFLLGTFLLGLMYVEGFRRSCAAAVRRLFRGARMVLVEWPAWFLRLPLVRRLLASPFYRVLARYVLKPLVFTGLTLAAFPALVSDPVSAVRSGVLVFLFSNILVNSRVGRDAEEVFTDWAVRGWYQFRIRIVAAAVQMVMEFFNRVVDTLDRFLYSVDEWLRFRSGQGRAAIVAKAVLGAGWFFVKYFVRFCINLLIEPQINPVKHFPVVTVSHKIIAPLCFKPLRDALLPLGSYEAGIIAGVVVFLLPGVVGFLVWELKENWRLYQANRPPWLLPVPVGHHGETLVRLLRPGFHSGTLPKLFARLRRAHRKAHWTANWQASHKQRRKIQQVEHTIRDFIERDLFSVLSQSRRWGGPALGLRGLEAGPAGTRFEFTCPELGETPLVIALEEQAGWLMARVVEPGWLDRLGEKPTQALADALTGFYKMAGVELVREQVDAALEPRWADYDVIEPGLLVRTDGGDAAVYDLRASPTIAPRAEAPPYARLPAFDREQVVFAASPVAWDVWVEVWDRDESGGRYPPQLVVGAHLLPVAAK